MTALKRFVAIGPESTGKSTLCQSLAQQYNTIWCPEYARAFLEANGNEYTFNDLLAIAEGHIALEEKKAREAKDLGKDLMFVDTDMYVMKVWCEYVFNNCHAFILNQIAARHYDGYLLCYPDLPWEHDPLREYPQQEIRQELFSYYKDLLVYQAVPWCSIFGNYEERFLRAVTFINSIRAVP